MCNPSQIKNIPFSMIKNMCNQYVPYYSNGVDPTIESSTVDFTALELQNDATLAYTPIYDSLVDLTALENAALDNTYKSSTTVERKQIAYVPRRPTRHRTMYSAHQIQTLEKEYGLSKKLFSTRRKILAKNLELSEEQVKVWFQNRRAKDRKEASSNNVNDHKNVSTENTSPTPVTPITTLSSVASMEPSTNYQLTLETMENNHKVAEVAVDTPSNSRGDVNTYENYFEMMQNIPTVAEGPVDPSSNSRSDVNAYDNYEDYFHYNYNQATNCYQNDNLVSQYNFEEYVGPMPTHCENQIIDFYTSSFD